VLYRYDYFTSFGELQVFISIVCGNKFHLFRVFQCQKAAWKVGKFVQSGKWQQR